MRTKLILQFLFLNLLASGFVCQGQTQESSQPDSLLAGLRARYADTALLSKIANVTDSLQSDSSACQYYAGELLKEAELQQNDYYKIQAYTYQIKLAYNSYDKETVEALMHQIEPLALKGGFYDDLFFARRCAIDMQLLNQNYEYCEKAAHQLLKDATEKKSKAGMLEAYQCLANLYRINYRPQLAIDMLEKARPIAIRHNRNGPIVNIYQTLVFLYQEQRDFPNWLKTLNRYRSYMQTQPLDAESYTINLIIYSSYLNYYGLQKDWTQGEKFRVLAEECYQQVNSPLYKIYYNSTCANYYSSLEQYDLALGQMEISLNLLKEISTGDEYYRHLYIKASLLCNADRSEESLPIFKDVIRFTDSLQVATINKQYEQLKKDYNADQLLLEQAQLQHRIQLYMLFLLGIGLLFMAYFLVHMQRTRRTLQKAEREMREMNQQMELANQAKDRFLSNISTSIRTPLNTVVDGSLQLAEGRVKEEKERLVLSDNIRKKASLLLKMINDILDLSRLEAGMMKFESSEIEITSTMLDAISSSAAFGNEVEIRADFAMDILYMTHTDGNRLAQVFKSFFDDKAADAACIIVKINYKEDKTLDILITGSVLTETVPAQEVIIRNEINRMLIEKFGGVYEFIDIEKPHDTIRFTVAIEEVITA